MPTETFIETKVLFLEGSTRNPDTLAFLARTPARKRSPHFSAYDCLKAIFDTRVFKTHPRAVFQRLKKPPKR